VRYKAAIALSNLAKSHPVNQAAMIDAGAIPALSTLINTDGIIPNTLEVCNDLLETLTKQAAEASAAEMSNTATAETIPFSHLVLQDELGRGGFGVVRKALWQGCTQVAVKQLLGSLTPELLEEFKAESAVHSRLHHPNIIALYGICVESMTYAMVMEFMERGSLYDVLRNPADLPWARRLCIARDIVSGLQYLHRKNIIHRDFKSLNVLVNEHYQAKVSDFGMAKIKLNTSTMTEGGRGTPRWMAPELFNKEPNSTAADVYATGVVFWEIAARKIPFEGNNLAQIVHKVYNGERETIPTETPPQFASLISRCWAQRSADRPTMTKLSWEVNAIVSGSSN
jgi:serine/threonine protein kinase